MVKRRVIDPEERCPKCNNITKYRKVSYFCDQCDIKLTENLSNKELRTRVFEFEGGGDDYHFCSWNCMWAWMFENKDKLNDPDFSFFDLPFIGKDAVEEFYESVRSLQGKMKNEQGRMVNDLGKI